MSACCVPAARRLTGPKQDEGKQVLQQAAGDDLPPTLRIVGGGRVAAGQSSYGSAGQKRRGEVKHETVLIGETQEAGRGARNRGDG